MFSSVYCFNFRVLQIIVVENLKHFSLRRFLVVVAVVLVFFVLAFLTLLTRLLDEVFYPAYRKTKISRPVFIVSTPRSGTTYLHRLLSLDQDRFSFFLLYHCFIPSVIFYRMIRQLKKLDQRLGGTFKRFWTKVERLVFAGWKGIHDLGFEKSEEDEGLFTLTLNSPAAGIFCPWFQKIADEAVVDDWPLRRKKKLMNYYVNSLQRFQFAWGGGKTLLVKNVMSSGRLLALQEVFPDARFILPIRHPLETVPSVTSMFSKPWKLIAPRLPENSPPFRIWGQVLVSLSKNLVKFQQTATSKQALFLSYEELIGDPVNAVRKIYDHYGMEYLPPLEARISASVAKERFSSGHAYSLERFGYSKEQLEMELNGFLTLFPFLKK